MAFSDDVDVPKWSWVQLTNADVTECTFVNKGGSALLVKATAGATPPTSTDGAIPYEPGAGEALGDLATLFPGVSSPTRLYAWGATDATVCMVSHA